MRKSDRATARQTVAVAFVGLLSPMIRRFPQALAGIAGRSAWLAVLLAIPLLPPAVLLSRRAAAALGREAPPRYLRAFWMLYGVWLLLYGGFLLRSGANRFVTTVYPRTGEGVFLLCMTGVCALAAAGGFRAVARMAMLLRPLLVAMPALLFLLSLRDGDFAMLLPVTWDDLPPNLLGAAEIVNLCGASFFLLHAGVVDPAELRARDWAGWGTALIALLGLLCCACLALFGPGLTAALSYPAFLLARDTPALGSLERVEPLVVAIWIFADVVLLAALLRCGALLLWRGIAPEQTPPGVLTPLCAILAAAAGLLLPAERDLFELISGRAVPLICAAFNLALPLLLALPRMTRKGHGRS